MGTRREKRDSSLWSRAVAKKPRGMASGASFSQARSVFQQLTQPTHPPLTVAATTHADQQPDGAGGQQDQRRRFGNDAQVQLVVGDLQRISGRHPVHLESRAPAGIRIEGRQHISAGKRTGRVDIDVGLIAAAQGRPIQRAADLQQVRLQAGNIKANVELLLSVKSPPSTSMPMLPRPPGLMVCGPLPATTSPAMDPFGPLASVPPLSVTSPRPVAEPAVLATTSARR